MNKPKEVRQTKYCSNVSKTQSMHTLLDRGFFKQIKHGMIIE